MNKRHNDDTLYSSKKQCLNEQNIMDIETNEKIIDVEYEKFIDDFKNRVSCNDTNNYLEDDESMYISPPEDELNEKCNLNFNIINFYQNNCTYSFGECVIYKNLDYTTLHDNYKVIIINNMFPCRTNKLLDILNNPYVFKLYNSYALKLLVFHDNIDDTYINICYNYYVQNKNI